MITYEQARQFRLDADIPLTWEGDVPAPPWDRIDLTRIILQTALDSGLGRLDLAASTGGEDKRPQIIAFQKRLRAYIPRQTCHGMPTRADGGETEDGVQWDGYRYLTWGEYLDWLEGNYYIPWKTSWLYGASHESEERVLVSLLATINAKRGHILPPDIDLGYSADWDEANGGSALAQLPPWAVGMDLQSLIKREFVCSIDPVEWKMGGMGETTRLLIGWFMTLLCVGVSVSGVLLRWYSGWWLLLLILLIPGLQIVLLMTIYRHEVKNWTDPALTVEKLAKRIVATKRREWETLQRAYGVK